MVLINLGRRMYVLRNVVKNIYAHQCASNWNDAIHFPFLEKVSRVYTKVNNSCKIVFEDKSYFEERFFSGNI